MEKDNLNGMKIKFKKDYFQDTVLNNKGEYIVKGKLKTMYHFSISKDYFMDNKPDIIKEAIADLSEVLKSLKELDKKNDIAMDSWDSISK